VITVGKEKIAVWKDDDGSAHAVSATCTHKGCTVTWNNADRTWDCLCHGSMFEADGSVIHGPAVKPLPASTLPSKRTPRRPSAARRRSKSKNGRSKAGAKSKARSKRRRAKKKL
jgi:nitrite reductase/ring-hydroxylating ferredoxin subunit